MPLHREKYRQAVLYFLHCCNNRHLGKTKLMKLMYYLDFGFFERHRSSVTGERYVRLHYGPVPESADSMLELMKGAGDVRIGQRTTAGGYDQTHYDPLVSFDLSVMSDDERAMLKAVAEEWRGVPLDVIVQASHDELPWQSVRPGEVIPYIHALRRTTMRPLSEEERDDMVGSAIGSLGLEGVNLSRDEATELFDRVMKEPLRKIE